MATVASGQVFKSQQEALRIAFPDSQKVARKTVFLDDSQVQKIQKRARAKVESKIVTFYIDESENGPTAFVFFERNTVRTKDEIFMVVVNPDASVRFIEMLAFYEPHDYLPTSKWFELFELKSLNDKLWPNREIHAVSGATLSVQAITLGVRKTLAIYKEVIQSQFYSTGNQVPKTESNNSSPEMDR